MNIGAEALEKESKEQRFVDYLEQLDRKGDRAALAALRRSHDDGGGVAWVCFSGPRQLGHRRGHRGKPRQTGNVVAGGWDVVGAHVQPPCCCGSRAPGTSG